MLHLPSGLGIPQAPLSFDDLGLTLAFIGVVAVVLLGGALWLIPRCRAYVAGRTSRRNRKRPLRVVTRRRPRAHPRPV
jgi:hypothetical protein